MGIAYKNFWSLNTDEAVVTGILRNYTDKNIEVLMPVNAQMKDIDLVLMNSLNKKITTVQVKGSKAFEPSKKESEKYGEGNVGWFFLDEKTILNATADYFIFLVYVIEEDLTKGRRSLEPHTIVIPTNKIQELTIKHKKRGKTGRYSYYFWINPKTKEVFDMRDDKYYVSEYLDKEGYSKLNKLISK
jgi:hypothetical protein